MNQPEARNSLSFESARRGNCPDLSVGNCPNLSFEFEPNASFPDGLTNVPLSTTACEQCWTERGSGKTFISPSAPHRLIRMDLMLPQTPLFRFASPIPFHRGPESSSSVEFQLFLDCSYQPSFVQNWYDEVSDFNSANINPFV